MNASSKYLPRRLVSIFSILTAFSLIFNAGCDIFTLNNKYSQWQTLKSIHLGNSHSEINPDLNAPGVWSRMKRDVKDETTSGPSDSNLIIDRSTLNGTEGAGRAFVHWIGKKTSEKFLILTCSVTFTNGPRQVTESELWISDDYGSTFHKKVFKEDAMISYFYSIPTDSKKLIFTDIGSKTVYTTSDELEKFESYEVPVDPDRILPHPFVRDALLLYSLLYRKLYVSLDFAKTWTLMGENVLPNFFWASKEYDEDLLVHMEIEGSIPTQALYKACLAPKCNKVNQKMDTVGPFLPKSLVIYNEFMFVQKLSADESESYLMVSHKRGPFQRAYFPENVKTNDFIILNLDDGQVFIGVNHGGKVNLYLSDDTGHFFVLSLTDVTHQIVRPFYFGISLHEAQGMNWTFLASARNSESKQVQTYISFDKGGNWAPLQVTDEMKKDCPSAENCDFKLVIIDSVLGSSIVSNENAPGIIMAHGTIGTSNVTVFTSRDGGWTWKKAPLTGTHRFNILDQGSVLSAVPAGILSNQVAKAMHYSVTEGETWIEEVFDSEGLLIKGVLNEPNILTLTEMLFGHETGRLQSWTLVKLNFTSILPRACEKEDYESWYPKDYNSKTSSECTLGRKLEYTRRKQKAACHNGQVLIPRVKPNQACECTAEDYECDFGYEEKSGACSGTKWFYDGYLPLDCKEGSVYYKTKGYRKIPADICIEKEAEKKKYGKKKSECPTWHPDGLLITAHNNYIVTAKEVSFFLEQTRGSQYGTTYTWNFDDSTQVENVTDYVNASHVVHIFTQSGHYNVSVKAENSKGKAFAFLPVHVQDRISSIYIMAPTAGKIDQPVKMSVAVFSSKGKQQRQQDYVHYVWNFGDETPSNLPNLSWNNTIEHTFKTAGIYDVSVEAVNSVSSLTHQFKIKMFEKAIIMVLTLSTLNIGREPNVNYISLLLERLQQQLLEDLGVNSDRIEVVLANFSPVQAHLYIFPANQMDETSSEEIKDKIVALVKSGEFGINLFGRRDEPGKIFKVDSIEPLSSPDDKKNHGPNMTPVYIAAPVLVIILVSSVFLFLYCRRRVRNVRQYNLLNTQDDSDALLDDDDEAPLDLDIDFGVRETSRDESMIDGGGNHLVMVTGDRSDGGENC